MIQEKDFLYRVPVKNVLVTTPRQQVRNPEILVDVEGGEFMHGNILDANSTNKLINQSVKDAVDNKLIESGYVTQDLLEAETTRATEQENSLKALIGAETSARTKGDEDLSTKIKAEQTRAEGKEKEISDKLAIVNGDSNTEGSFRKAIADVVAAAPEDLDTLKEIADKLAGNDDLHTALNQAITEKADASALLNEVTRATGAESGLQAAIATKADATALSNYVLTTALNKQVDTLNAAISAKQDAGNYIPYARYENNEYIMLKNILVEGNGGKNALSSRIGRNGLSVYKMTNADIYSNIQCAKIELQSDENRIRIEGDSIVAWKRDNFAELGISDEMFSLSKNGVAIYNGDNNHVLTSNASTIDITQYAKKSELPTVPTKTSQLTNDSNFIAADAVDDNGYTLERQLKFGNEVDGYSTIGKGSITVGDEHEYFDIDKMGFRGHGINSNCSFATDGVYMTSDGKIMLIDLDQIVSSANGKISFLIDSDAITLGDPNIPKVKISSAGIKFAGKTSTDIPTANGTFINITEQIDHAVNDYNFISQQQADSRYALADTVNSLSAGLSKKQNRITVNEVDITDIETADITKLRTIVTNLINALSESDLIRKTKTLE